MTTVDQPDVLRLAAAMVRCWVRFDQDGFNGLVDASTSDELVQALGALVTLLGLAVLDARHNRAEAEAWLDELLSIAADMFEVEL